MFEVRIIDMIDQTEQSIEVGITTLQPDTMMLLNIQSKTWCMRGCHIWLNQEILTRNYGINLKSLKVRICTYICSTIVYACM